VVWKTCEKEAKRTLRIEANIYSTLKECQGMAFFFLLLTYYIAIIILGNIIPQLLYEGYAYDGYFYVLILQLIEDTRHIDPGNLSAEEKKTIVRQLETIHSYGILHAQKNILLEPKSHQFFFIDLIGLSEFVNIKSKKLYEKILNI